MNRFFNIAGPCQPGQHYMLNAQARCGDLHWLIERQLFFVIHAARQTGKTTLLKSLAHELNQGIRYHALYCSLESVQPFTEPERGIPAIVDALRGAQEFHPALAGLDIAYDALLKRTPATMVRLLLSDLARKADRPLVVLFDEADCLGNGTLLAFLRQLRDGYINRGEIPFVHSLALVGMRNIRDYKGSIREDAQTLGSASPFNVVTAALTIRGFHRDEIALLYGQHTADTGQAFLAAAVDRAFYWTQGQPWLVNAIAREVVEEILAGDRARPIGPELIDEAANRIVMRRDTHIDSLLERLKEDRVRRVIEPVLLGLEHAVALQSDDCQYVLDLGLLRDVAGRLEPANPIYSEVIVRALSYDSQYALETRIGAEWADGRNLDMNGLLRAFQQFWRENSDIWIEPYQYREAAPHLILQAFLQRVINGGGRIQREMALGTRRLDLCVEYAGHRYPLELKVRRARGPAPEAEGLEQLARYMDTVAADEGWLIIFDQRPDIPWDTRISWQDTRRDHRTLHVVGC